MVTAVGFAGSRGVPVTSFHCDGDGGGDRCGGTALACVTVTVTEGADTLGRQTGGDGDEVTDAGDGG